MITFFFQLVIPVALMFFRFQKRRYFVLRVIGFGLLFFGLSALFYSPTAIPFLPPQVGYFLYYLLGYVFAFLYAYLCFDIPASNVLFFCLASFLVQNLAHHIFELIMRIIGVAAGSEYDRIEWLSILTAVYAVIYAIYFFVYIRRLQPEDFLNLQKTSTLAVAGAFLLVMVVLGIFVRHIRTDLFSAAIIAIGYELYSIILDFLIIGLQFGVFRNSRLRESNTELERRLEREAQYYDTAKANMDLINIKCHDLKHQIAALATMSDETERKSSIDELKQAIMIYDGIAKTGNDALDCLLTEKGLYCQHSGITFSYIADGAGLNAMKYGDIYALFGNALDNAFESVMQSDEQNKRVVALKVFERGGQTCIHIENYCEKPPKLSDGLPVTTKKGEGHGFGMKSIRYIVKKYGGNFTVRFENNIFSLDILLPLS